MPLSVLACQIDVPAMTTAKQRDTHIDRCVAVVDSQLAKHTVDLVVLPELSSIDYSREAFASLDVLAEPVQGASFARWSALARKHQCHVVYGFASAEADNYSIATAVVSPQGECTIYHKLHLAQFGDSMEKEYFVAGDPRLVVVEINGFRISPIICYDIRLPELCRTLALEHNVDCILHTGAYARDASFYSWHSFAMARAIENQVYFLSLNRAGRHFGHSVFCQPWMDEHNTPLEFPEHNEHFERLALNRECIASARRDYTFLQDRLSSYDLPVIEM